MIFTNCAAYYKIPFVIAPVGKSDHRCVLLSPGPCVRPSALVRWVHRQCLDDDILNELSFEISRIRWQDMYIMQQCNDMVEFFYASMSHVISKVVPTTLVKFSSSD